MRLRRLRAADLISVRMGSIYPLGVYSSSGKAGGRMDAHGHEDTQARGAGRSATDPVCGMTVDPRASAHRHAYRDHEYFFCSAGCRTKFAADPSKYLGTQATLEAPATPPGGIYTCPMHPEIRQQGP